MPSQSQKRRAAIDLLKAAHIDGLSLTLAEAQGLLQKGGFPRKQLGKRHVGDLLKQSRLELSDTNVSVTNPVRRNGYRSNPNATPSERIVSRDPLLKEVVAKSSNLLRYLKSDGNQVDASPVEIERRTLLSVGTELLARAAKLQAVGPDQGSLL